MDTDNAQSECSVVGGMTLFWIFFLLVLANATHPLGQNEFRPEVHRYLRCLVSYCVADTFVLYWSIINTAIRSDISLLQAAELVARNRLHKNEQSGTETSGAGDAGIPLRILGSVSLNGLMMDARARLMFDVLPVLSYAKICGFSGVPALFAFATALFLSWLLAELVLVALYCQSILAPPCSRPDRSGGKEGREAEWGAFHNSSHRIAYPAYLEALRVFPVIVDGMAIWILSAVGMGGMPLYLHPLFYVVAGMVLMLLTYVLGNCAHLFFDSALVQRDYYAPKSTLMMYLKRVVVMGPVASLLYFTVVYDPAGTCKAAWTEQLG